FRILLRPVLSGRERAARERRRTACRSAEGEPRRGRVRRVVAQVPRELRARPARGVDPVCAGRRAGPADAGDLYVDAARRRAARGMDPRTPGPQSPVYGLRTLQAGAGRDVEPGTRAE